MSKRFLSFGCALGFLVLVLTFPLGSKAQTTIYDNLGPGNSYTGNGGRIIAGSEAYPLSAPFIPAMPFVPSENMDLSQILIALTWDSQGTNAVTVTLNSDDTGVPGTTIIESWSLTGLPAFGSTSTTVQTLSSSSDVFLSGGTTYWLLASPSTPNTQAVWNLNSTGASGTYASFAVGSWYSYSGTLGAFTVEGTPLAPVPEPSSYILLGSGLIALLLLRRLAQQQV